MFILLLSEKFLSLEVRNMFFYISNIRRNANFIQVTSPAKKGSPGFTWSIDEIALIQPAKIDEFPVQQMHCSDPEMEKNAQEAISRFFSENQIIPSPYDVRRNEIEMGEGLRTPTRGCEDINVSKESLKSKKEKRDGEEYCQIFKYSQL